MSGNEDELPADEDGTQDETETGSDDNRGDRQRLGDTDEPLIFVAKDRPYDIHGEGDIEDGGEVGSPTEMAIGDVRVPGVYEITQTGEGMTGKYMAEQYAAEGEENPYTDQGDETDDDYAAGTLLNQNAEPYTNADTGQRIRIGEDQLNGETYAEPVENYATVLDDDPETPETNEAGWVVDANGERINVNDPEADEEDATRPLTLAEGGYTIHPGSGDESEEESDEEESDDEESEEESEDESATGGSDPEGSSPRFGEQIPGQAGTNPEGYDSIRPPAIEVTVRAYCTDDTWEELDALRDQERPFDIAIGEYSIERMGILDLSRQMAGDLHAANDVTVKLKQFREVTVQTPGQPTGQQSPGETGTGGDFPVKGWTDHDGDGMDDRTGEPIPEPEDITVDPGETYVADVGPGELWGNKHIDVSAEGASAKIDATGDGWIIKNVGIEGGLVYDGSVAEGFGHSTIAVDGSGVIENVYLGDGAASADTNRMNGIYVHPSAGDIAINAVNVQGMGTNGIYASAGGTVDVTNTYSAHNNVANLRLNGGDTADSVMLNTDGSGASTTSGTNRRGLWAWDGRVGVTNSTIRNTSEHDAIATTEGGSVTLTDTTVEGNISGDVEGATEETAQVHQPAGVPSSASDAADGMPPTGGRAGTGSGSGRSGALAYANFESNPLPSALTSRENTSNVSHASQSYEGSSSLQITFPAGSHFGLAAEFNPSRTITAMACTYWLRFSEGFQVDSNVSKLPGPLDARRGAPSAGNPSNGSNGWSMRLGFTSGSGSSIDLGYYAYYVGQNSSYGEFLNGSGASVQPGEWVKIGQLISLNSEAGANDGRAQLRINGNTVVNRTNMEYTNTPSDGISYRFAAYYGGNAPSPQTQSVFIDDWSVTGL